jgi:hypothetical protein
VPDDLAELVDRQGLAEAVVAVAREDVRQDAVGVDESVRGRSHAVDESADGEVTDDLTLVVQGVRGQAEGLRGENLTDLVRGGFGGCRRRRQREGGNESCLPHQIAPLSAPERERVEARRAE